jgi:hypothetical protein
MLVQERQASCSKNFRLWNSQLHGGEKAREEFQSIQAGAFLLGFSLYAATLALANFNIVLMRLKIVLMRLKESK